MRFRTPLLLLALGVTFSTLGASDLEAQRRTRIRLTTLAPRGSSYHRSLQQMGETWRELSDGRVELTIYPGGIQGGEAAMVERMFINQAQAAMLTAVGLEEIEPSVAGLQYMPMMFRSLEELDYVAERVQPLLEQRLLERGFVVLFWGDTGWVRFFSRNPVVHVDDLRGMKLFTTAGNSRTEEILNQTGMTAVPLETSDILTGLQTGLIDAVPIPPFFALAAQIYRPAPHMLQINWVPLVGALVVKRDVWEGIPAPLRAEMLQAARVAGAEIHEAGRRENEEAVESMRTRWNLMVHEVPEGSAIEAEWRAAAEAAYPEIRGGLVPAEIFDRVQNLLTEYRSQQSR